MPRPYRDATDLLEHRISEHDYRHQGSAAHPSQARDAFETWLYPLLFALYATADDWGVLVDLPFGTRGTVAVFVLLFFPVHVASFGFPNVEKAMWGVVLVVILLLPVLVRPGDATSASVLQSLVVDLGLLIFGPLVVFRSGKDIERFVKICAAIATLLAIYLITITIWHGNEVSAARNSIEGRNPIALGRLFGLGIIGIVPTMKLGIDRWKLLCVQAAALGGLVFAMFLTGSRGPLVAVALALTLYVLWSSDARAGVPISRVLPRVAALIGAVVVVFGFAVRFLSRGFFDSSGDRFHLFAVAFRGIDADLFGDGYRTFSSPHLPGIKVHNLVLEMAIEGGVFVTFLVLAFLGLAGIANRSAALRSVLAFLFVALQTSGSRPEAGLLLATACWCGAFGVLQYHKARPDEWKSALLAAPCFALLVSIVVAGVGWVASASADEMDSRRAAAASEVVLGLESFARANGTATITGAGRDGSGEGYFQLEGRGFYERSIATALVDEGIFGAGLVPNDPEFDRREYFDFMVFPCADRVAVLTVPGLRTPDESLLSWWEENDCSAAPFQTRSPHSMVHLSGPLQLDVTAPAPTIEGVVIGADEGNDGVAPGYVSIRGSAVDDWSGINTASLLVRNGSGDYWNGSAWAAGPHQFRADLVGGQIEIVIPLQPGSHEAQLLATDRARNQGASDWFGFAVEPAETVAPTLEVLTPLNEEIVSVGNVQFSASVADADSGIESVRLEVQRTDNLLFWDGDLWQEQRSSVSMETLDGIASTSLRLDTGTYLAQFVATDVAGNSRSGLSRFGVGVSDVILPKVMMHRPGDGEIVGTGSVIFAGSAIDEESGISTAELRLMDASNSLYWSGSEWVASSSTSIPMNVDGSTISASVDLAPGNYMSRVQVFDGAGNARSEARWTRFAVGSGDLDAPFARIVSVQEDSRIPAGEVALVAEVEDVLSDIATVRFQLHEIASNLYFDGINWGSAATYIEADPTQPNPAIALPLTVGTYRVRLLAADTFSNQTTTGWIKFGVGDADLGLPDVAVTAPEVDERLGAGLVTFRGTAEDAESEIVTVEAELRDMQAKEFWDGTRWHRQQSLWLMESGDVDFSAVAVLPDGAYRVRLKATDSAGNVKWTPTVRFAVGSGDIGDPSVAFETPSQNNTAGVGLMELRGSAMDESGIDRFAFRLKDKATEKFWNGSTWQSAPVVVDAESASDVGATLQVSLEPGSYKATLLAWDTFGNSASAVTEFQVVSE